MMNKHRSLKLFAVISVATVATLVVAGCSHQDNTPSTPPANPAPVVVQNTHPSQVTIYSIAKKDQINEADPNGLVSNTVPLAVDSPTPAKDALEKLADNPNGPLPKGTKVLDLSIDKTGLATVNFSSEFQKNFPGGDTEEAQVISSVLETLGQFPNIKNAQFLVEGQKIASLGGTQDLDDPLPVIRVEPNPAAASSNKQDVAMDNGPGQ